MDFYQAHRKTKNEHFNLPQPPAANYQCWSCDKKEREDFEKRSDEYVKNFFNEESNLIKKALSICRSLELLGRGDAQVTSSRGFAETVDNAFRHNRNDASKNGPCYGLKTSDMW